jgi:hypothetical protein
VLRPPRERPTACFCSPLFHPPPSGALSRAWSRSSACRWIVRSQQAPGTGFPRRRAAPSAQSGCRALTFIGRTIRRWTLRCRRTIVGRAIAPATAALQHVHDAANDAAIVHPLDAPDIRRQVRFDPLPLLIAQPKQVPAHDPNPLPKTNQDRIVSAEKLMSSDPSRRRGHRVRMIFVALHESGNGRLCCKSILPV